jgi:hypothetical protein
MTAYRLRAASDSDAEVVAAIWLAGWREAHLAHVPAALAAVRTPESFHSRAARRVGDTVVAVTGRGPFDYAARTDDGTVVVPCHRYVKRL